MKTLKKIQAMKENLQIVFHITIFSSYLIDNCDWPDVKSAIRRIPEYNLTALTSAMSKSFWGI